MKKAKGIVMRTSGNKTVIYTDQGDFLEIPTPEEPPLVGQVLLVDLAPQKPAVKPFFLRYVAAAAVLVLALALGIFNPLFGPGAAVASVALDINSGVELYVNKEAKVVRVRDAGNGLSNTWGGLELKGQDVYDAVALILKEAGAKGDLGKEQNLVLATVVPVSDRGVKVVNEEKLRGIIQDELLSRNVSGIVMVSEASQEVKRQAENLGMTVNNYLVYDRCRQGGLDVQADAFRGGNVGKALEGANVSLTGLFPGESCEVKPDPWQGQSGNMAGQPAGAGGSQWQEMEQNRSPGTNTTQGYQHEGAGNGNMEGSGSHEGTDMQEEPERNWEQSDSWGGQDVRSSGGNPSPAQPTTGTAPQLGGQSGHGESGQEEGEGMHETWRPSQPKQQPAAPSGSGGREEPTIKKNEAGETWKVKPGMKGNDNKIYVPY